MGRESGDVVEAATSRIQKSEIRKQNFKVSPAATDLNGGCSAGACALPEPESETVRMTGALLHMPSGSRSLGEAPGPAPLWGRGPNGGEAAV